MTPQLIYRGRSCSHSRIIRCVVRQVDDEEGRREDRRTRYGLQADKVQEPSYMLPRLAGVGWAYNPGPKKEGIKQTQTNLHAAEPVGIEDLGDARRRRNSQF